jgi:hypothetical protein
MNHVRRPFEDDVFFVLNYDDGASSVISFGAGQGCYPAASPAGA